MKPIKYFLVLSASLLFLSTNSFCQQSNKTNTVDKMIQQKTEQKTIANAQKGDLICTDENGKYVLCTGKESESIKGFTTNVPYVTPNKPLTPEAKKDEFQALASSQNGEIKAGDFVCPCSEPGKVVKCTRGNRPYAKALEDASTAGQSFKVRVLRGTK